MTVCMQAEELAEIHGLSRKPIISLYSAKVDNSLRFDVAEAYIGEQCIVSTLDHLEDLRINRIFLLGAKDNLRLGNVTARATIEVISVSTNPAYANKYRLSHSCATTLQNVVSYVDPSLQTENDPCWKAFKADGRRLRVATFINVSPFTVFSQTQGTTDRQ